MKRYSPLIFGLASLTAGVHLGSGLTEYNASTENLSFSKRGYYGVGLTEISADALDGDAAAPLDQLPEDMKLRIIHFNDIYNIEQEKDKGGAGPFVTAINHFREEGEEKGETLTLFSGDLLTPSLLSSVYKGEQTVLPFNNMKIDAACIGNHELDFGVQWMYDQLYQTMPDNAPDGMTNWISSNLVEKGKDTLGKMPRSTVITKG